MLFDSMAEAAAPAERPVRAGGSSTHSDAGTAGAPHPPLASSSARRARFSVASDRGHTGVSHQGGFFDGPAHGGVRSDWRRSLDSSAPGRGGHAAFAHGHHGLAAHESALFGVVRTRSLSRTASIPRDDSAPRLQQPQQQLRRSVTSDGGGGEQPHAGAISGGAHLHGGGGAGVSVAGAPAGEYEEVSAMVVDDNLMNTRVAVGASPPRGAGAHGLSL